MRILLVEDDENLATALGWSLKDEGFDTLKAGSIKEAKDYFGKEDIDLVLLDVTLPDGEGYEFCEHVRSTDARLPIIFLTAMDAENQVVRAFSSGADDYVTKPFRMAELVARIRSKLRGRQVIGSFQIDESRLCLRKKDERIDLSPNEYRLLKLFTEHSGEVLGKDQIIKELWGAGGFADNNAVAVYIKRLREKLKDENGNDPIKTVRGEGYRWEDDNDKA